MENLDDLVCRGGRRPVRPRVRDPSTDAPIFTRGRSAAARPGRGRRPAGPAGARATRNRHPGRHRGAGSPPPCGRGRPAQAAAAACSATTTCSPGSPTRSRPARRRGPRRGCGRGGRWCWSTSSRTPTRCSGRCCERAFAGHATLVLIGDPKQAIYAFRGGDVVTYLAAARTADASATLGTQLAQRRRPAGRRAAGVARRGRAGRPGHRRPPGRRGAPRDRGWSAPRRSAAAAAGGAPRRRFGMAGAASIPIDRSCASFVARDLAADIAALLASGATFDGRPLAAATSRCSCGTHEQATCGRGGARGRGHSGGRRRRGQRVPPRGRRRLARPAGGAGAAAPCRAGSGRRR